MKKNERTGAPLVEIIISIGILAIVGSIVVVLFLGAHYAAVFANDKNEAVFVAQSAVENALMGNEQGLEAFTKQGDTYTLYYNEDWINSGEALFEVVLTVSEQDNMRRAEVEVRRLRSYPFLNGERTGLFSLSGERYIAEVGS